jgi:hypothetical protein
MFDILTFDSLKEMQNFIESNSEAVMSSLARQQQDLTLGSYWVQFEVEPFTDEPLVVFGQVVTELEWDADEDEPSESQRRTMNLTGLMFGRAASKHFPEPELGYTHKASAWPIEQRLFDMAREVDWDIQQLPHAGKVLLEIAYASRRAHALGLIAQGKPTLVDLADLREQVWGIVSETFYQSSTSTAVDDATDKILDVFKHVTKTPR